MRKTITLGCYGCGSEFSTTLGDYFWMSSDRKFTCCDEGGELCFVVVDKITSEHVTNADHRTVKTVTTTEEVFYKEAPTYADLERAHDVYRAV